LRFTFIQPQQRKNSSQISQEDENCADQIMVKIAAAFHHFTNPSLHLSSSQTDNYITALFIFLRNPKAKEILLEHIGIIIINLKIELYEERQSEMLNLISKTFIKFCLVNKDWRNFSKFMD
jgi:hypothetical protein